MANLKTFSRIVCCFTKYHGKHSGKQSCNLARIRGIHGTPKNSDGTPLQGIRVLDLTRILAGPYCTMILGDWGADIIKIEQPCRGDDTRTWGPPFCGTESAYFLSVNRNKKSVAVNFKSREGQEIIKELAGKSDVLIENFVPGSLAKYKLSYNDLKDITPELIYCSLSGYGQNGPYSKRAGFDVVAAALGGLMHITGPEDGEPCRVGVAMTDLSTGLYACGAIIAALLQRQKTGRGQHIDCNLLSTQVATLTHIGANFLSAGAEARRHGTGHVSIVPYQAFRTKDGEYLIIGAGNNQHFQVVCKLTNHEHLIEDVKFIDNQSRVSNRKELINVLSQRFLEKVLSEWLDIFEDSGIPYGPVNDMDGVFQNEQVLHNNMIQSFDHPTAGKVKIPGPAVKFSGFDIQLKTVPPTLGQHTDQILKYVLNYSEDRINKLKQDKVTQ